MESLISSMTSARTQGCLLFSNASASETPDAFSAVLGFKPPSLPPSTRKLLIAYRRFERACLTLRTIPNAPSPMMLPAPPLT